MFDYDRDLNIAQQLAVNVDATNGQKKAITRTLTDDDDTLPFMGPLDSSPSEDDGEKTDDNAIVHGLEGLLRRCSSPNNGFHIGQFRQKSASVGSDHLYSMQFLSKRPPFHLLDTQRHKFASNGTSLDMQHTFRRLSGGSSGALADGYECDTSSGYGSPGALGTPLASPAMGSAQFHAAQLHKLFMDTAGISEEDEASPVPSLHNQPQQQQHIHHQILPHHRFVDAVNRSPPLPTANALPAMQRRRMATMATTTGLASATTGPMHPNLLMTNATAPSAQNGGGAVTVLKATTTTTGTNKNSNKRKTSLNTAGQGNGAGGVNKNGGNGGATNGVPPAVEQIVPTEDGFDFREIKEFTQLLHSPRRVPPPRYICHICYQPGHYISDCPARFNSPYEELTPYQGRKKCYGEFQCEQCKRKWTSQNSVANEAQSCIKCHVPVFPHKQLPVDKAVALGLVKLQRLPVTNIGSTSTENLIDQCTAAGIFIDDAPSGNAFNGLNSDSASSSPSSLDQPMPMISPATSLMI
ncbi:hypothetical protein niasHS_005393 [Heterodera schachtii]|uniref:CCHC-type domain-containing protein n=1 Tax=Heterodera schachtii TaxID=97005 RepID=A0ABD2J985_HETSC